MSANETQAIAAASAGRLEEVIEVQRQLLARATSSEKVLLYAAEAACRITGCESAAVFTQDGDWLVRRAESGLEPPGAARLPGASSLVGLCFRSGELQSCADTEDDPRVDRDLSQRLQVRSAVAAPLISSRGVEGVLRAGSPRPGAFSADDLQLMQVVGGMIGAALEVSALFGRTQQQTENIQSVLEETSRSEQVHRSLFDENPTPMCIYDPATFRLLRGNAAALALYGYTAEEFAAREIFHLLAQDEHQRLREVLVATPHGRRQGVWRHVRKDGAALEVQVVAHAFEFDGKPTRLVIINDDTERLKAERNLAETRNQLVQSDKMASVGQLAAGVAHEINNPIGYVYSNLGTLGKYLDDLLSMLDLYGETEAALPGDSALLERIRNRKRQVDIDFLREDLPTLMAESRDGITRVKKIVQDLKDFSHADTRDDWQSADLRKGLDSTLNIVHNELKYKCDVVKEYGELPAIECLPSQLNQVFMNLMVNAAHAIKDRGTITLRAAMRGAEACVEVADTGGGIPADNLKRIFDPFFTTKPVGKGTGLGLSLSYGIVKKHAGRIEVDSEVGKGTTFRVILPLRRPAPPT